MLPLEHKTTDPTDDAEKKSRNYEKRKENIGTKLPHLWNHHKIGVVGGGYRVSHVGGFTNQHLFGNGYVADSLPCYTACYEAGLYAYSDCLLNLVYSYPNRINHIINLTGMEHLFDKQSGTASFELVEYSPKSIALFGDTKRIKDLLAAIGGKFNPRLTYKNGKRAGWIFQLSKREELITIINLNK